MRTTINVDDSIIEDLMKYSGAKSKTGAVNEAIVEYVRSKKIETLISLLDEIEFEDDWEEFRHLDREKAGCHNVEPDSG